MYFVERQGQGQYTLYSLLKAYAALDPEVSVWKGDGASSFRLLDHLNPCHLVPPSHSAPSAVISPSRDQVGYMQGMGFIAAVLLLHMPMKQVCNYSAYSKMLRFPIVP